MESIVKTLEKVFNGERKRASFTTEKGKINVSFKCGLLYAKWSGVWEDWCSLTKQEIPSLAKTILEMQKDYRAIYKSNFYYAKDSKY